MRSERDFAEWVRQPADCLIAGAYGPHAEHTIRCGPRWRCGIASRREIFNSNSQVG
jgi:hypothetical protein